MPATELEFVAVKHVVEDFVSWLARLQELTEMQAVPELEQRGGVMLLRGMWQVQQRQQWLLLMEQES